VELVQKFFQAEGKTAVDGDTVAKALGYGSANGNSRTKLGALKQYGLMQGRTDQVSITPLGIRVCHPESDEEYLEALREAARKPEVLSALMETHLAASENAVMSHLIKARGFTAEGARLLARSLRIPCHSLNSTQRPIFLLSAVTKPADERTRECRHSSSHASNRHHHSPSRNNPR